MKAQNLARGMAGVILLVLIIVIAWPNAERDVQSAQNERRADVEVVAQNLDIPWEIVFLPSGEMLVTERPGNLVRISESKEIIPVAGVTHRGEGGLLGVALHPDFAQNNILYLYLTSFANGGIENRVERYTLNLEKNQLENRQVILDRIPGAQYHDGGRVAFGPDGYLYITTGDAGDPDNAQNINSLAGKIVRVDENGTPAQDNPFNNAVYSHGHRNPQGITWDDTGTLWATEHGRSGLYSGYDELNVIEPGINYGWDIIQGDETLGSMQTPVIHSGSDTTWAPAGTVYYRGNIFFTGLRGETLYQYNIEDQTITQHFTGEYGRLRALTLYENNFYISTSNRDGRGSVNDGDDKIIRVNAETLLE